MSWREYVPLVKANRADDDLAEAFLNKLGGADALAMLPYDDGTFYFKPAYFDKELIGGLGGYETDDGDKIAVDGTGEATREFRGVPIVLAVDPTEHAAAVEPTKALIAHKDDIGEWVRVDNNGDVVQVGPALEPAPAIVESETVEEAFDTMSDEELLTLFDPDFDPEGWSAGDMAAEVGANEDQIKAIIEERLKQTEEIGENGAVGGGGKAGQMVRESRKGPGETFTFEEALTELSKDGDITKVYDLAPPARPVGKNGEIEIEEATHVAVDQSKAADLLPTTWDTVEINTALDKARMEERDEGKLMKYMIYGIIIGAVTTIVAGALFLGINAAI